MKQVNSQLIYEFAQYLELFKKEPKIKQLSFRIPEGLEKSLKTFCEKNDFEIADTVRLSLHILFYLCGEEIEGDDFYTAFSGATDLETFLEDIRLVKEKMLRVRSIADECHAILEQKEQVLSRHIGELNKVLNKTIKKFGRSAQPG